MLLYKFTFCCDHKFEYIPTRILCYEASYCDYLFFLFEKYIIIKELRNGSLVMLNFSLSKNKICQKISDGNQTYIYTCSNSEGTVLVRQVLFVIE